MTIRVKLKETVDEIADAIERDMAEQWNKRLNSTRRRLYAKLRLVTAQWIMGTPEMQSLLSEGRVNTLSAEFGLWYGSASRAVAAITKAVVEAIVIQVRPIKIQGRKWSGGIDIGLSGSGFLKLLSLPEGTVMTEKGYQLDWLQWLLVRGDDAIIVGYDYEPYVGEGRSRGGLMEKGGIFRVDPAYSGTPEDNFITRALAGRQKEVADIMKRIVR